MKKQRPPGGKEDKRQTASYLTSLERTAAGIRHYNSRGLCMRKREGHVRKKGKWCGGLMQRNAGRSGWVKRESSSLRYNCLGLAVVWTGCDTKIAHKHQDVSRFSYHISSVSGFSPELCVGDKAFQILLLWIRRRVDYITTAPGCDDALQMCMQHEITQKESNGTPLSVSQNVQMQWGRRSAREGRRRTKIKRGQSGQITADLLMFLLN